MGVFDFESSEDYKIFTTSLKKYYQPIGLNNIGNTCYMNSLLQALSGCNQFMDYVGKLWHNIQLVQTDLDSIITFQFLNVLQDMSKGSKNTSPEDIHDVLCQEFTRLFVEQDSHELLVYLQEKITKITAQHLREIVFDEGLASPEIAISTQSESPKEYYENDCINKSQASNNNYKKNLIMVKELAANKRIGLNPFAGVYLSTIQCLKCGPEEALHRWEVSYDLSLDSDQSLEKSLQRYFASEIIDDYICIKCSLRAYLENFPKDISEIEDEQMQESIYFMRQVFMQHDLDEESFVSQWKKFKEETKNTAQHNIDKLKTRITKQWSIKTPPKIMCLHLKRLQYGENGVMLNNRFMQYPQVLDLSNIANQKDVQQLDVKYKLSAIIEHFGTSQGGHYVAYKKLFPTGEQSESDVWVLADDDRIKILDSKEILGRKAYMLFYEKINETY